MYERRGRVTRLSGVNAQSVRRREPPGARWRTKAAYSSPGARGTEAMCASSPESSWGSAFRAIGTRERTAERFTKSVRFVIRCTYMWIIY